MSRRLANEGVSERGLWSRPTGIVQGAHDLALTSARRGLHLWPLRIKEKRYMQKIKSKRKPKNVQ